MYFQLQNDKGVLISNIHEARLLTLRYKIWFVTHIAQLQYSVTMNLFFQEFKTFGNLRAMVPNLSLPSCVTNTQTSHTADC